MTERSFEPRIFTNSREKMNTVCRYYLRGFCNRGEQCQYLHVRSETDQTQIICRYFLNNSCAFGDTCRYRHFKADTDFESSSPTSSNSPSSTSTNSSSASSNSSPTASSSPSPTSSNSPSSTSSNSSSAFLDSSLSSSPSSSTPESELDSAYHALVDKLISSLNLDEDLPEKPERSPSLEPEEVESDDVLCPLNFVGLCRNQYACGFLHGTKCEVCKMAKLHPWNQKQRERHERECIAEHEKQSQDMECGICQENVMTNEDLHPENRFAILDSCNHCFCSRCLIQWRFNVNESVERNKTCPMCRAHSDNFILNKYWTESPEEKKQLMKNFDEELEQSIEIRILNLLLFLTSFESN